MFSALGFILLEKKLIGLINLKILKKTYSGLEAPTNRATQPPPPSITSSTFPHAMPISAHLQNFLRNCAFVICRQSRVYNILYFINNYTPTAAVVRTLLCYIRVVHYILTARVVRWVGIYVRVGVCVRVRVIVYPRRPSQY